METDHVFLTQRLDNHAMAGERIHAKSWDEALEKAKQIGVEVIGILQDEHIYYEPV